MYIYLRFYFKALNLCSNETHYVHFGTHVVLSIAALSRSILSTDPETLRNHDCTITQYIMISIIMSFGYPIDFAIMQPSHITKVHYDELTGLAIFVKVYETKCIFRLLNIWYGNDMFHEV